MHMPKTNKTGQNQTVQYKVDSDKTTHTTVIDYESDYESGNDHDQLDLLENMDSYN